MSQGKKKKRTQQLLLMEKKSVTLKISDSAREGVNPTTPPRLANPTASWDPAHQNPPAPSDTPAELALNTKGMDLVKEEMNVVSGIHWNAPWANTDTKETIF